MLIALFIDKFYTLKSNFTLKLTIIFKIFTLSEIYLAVYYLSTYSSKLMKKHFYQDYVFKSNKNQNKFNYPAHLFKFFIHSHIFNSISSVIVKRPQIRYPHSKNFTNGIASP